MDGKITDVEMKIRQLNDEFEAKIMSSLVNQYRVKSFQLRERASKEQERFKFLNRLSEEYSGNTSTTDEHKLIQDLREEVPEQMYLVD